MPSSFFAWLGGATLAVRAVVIVLALALLIVGGCAARHVRALEAREAAPAAHFPSLLFAPLVALPALFAR